MLRFFLQVTYIINAFLRAVDVTIRTQERVTRKQEREQNERIRANWQRERIELLQLQKQTQAAKVMKEYNAVLIQDIEIDKKKMELKRLKMILGDDDFEPFRPQNYP